MPTFQTTTGDEPGEELFLSHRPGSGTALRLGGTAAFDACTVLPMSAVLEVGIELEPKQHVRHDFMERDAPGDRSLARLNLEGLSNCAWPGVDDQIVALQIYQPPYSHEKDRTERLEFLERKGAKRESARGLSAFTVHGRNDPKDWQVSLFADGYWALLLLKTNHESYRAGSPQDVVDTLVDRVAENLLRGPTGPSSFAYGGPYADFPDPCELFTREDFRQAYGVDDVGRVHRGLTGGEGLLTGDRPGERARFIRLTCGRKALGRKFADEEAPGLEVAFDVFPDAEEAGLMEFGVCDPKSSATKVFGPPLPISTTIGDGRVCMPNEGRPNRRLAFRVGRTMVYLHNWLYADATDLNALAAKLTPIAQTIAGRLA